MRPLGSENPWGAELPQQLVQGAFAPQEMEAWIQQPTAGVAQPDATAQSVPRLD